MRKHNQKKMKKSPMKRTKRQILLRKPTAQKSPRMIVKLSDAGVGTDVAEDAVEGGADVAALEGAAVAARGVDVAVLEGADDVVAVAVEGVAVDVPDAVVAGRMHSKPPVE